ncbi:MAG: cell wall-binding repeat-containing protein [Acidobacteria bacterium]|nr:cell wall-binding repeat-containing protein [Acidobacteriota bacterium]
MRRILVAMGIVTLAILPFIIVGQAQPPTQAIAPAATAADEGNRLTWTTPNTIRLSGPNIYAAATAITQATYGATHHEDRPHAITLVRADRQADAMLAASRITHFPVNSPVLYVDAERLPPETFAEMKRLRPDGNTYDAGVQVYLVGPIAASVEREVRDQLNYKTRAFRNDNPFALSEELDTWAAAVHADHPDEVIIVQYEQLQTGLPAVAWNAHMGHGLFFVQGDVVPEPTKRALSRRFRGEAFLYLFGDPAIISARVARELAAYGHVQRVPGRDAYEISVNFAGFRDAGMNQGYWLGWWARDFGWGIAKAGHNFTFANPDDWQQAVTGSLLSHLGKHGPLILVRPDGVSESAARYLQLVKPTWGAANDQLNNHGWILGGTDRIKWETQADIDGLLEARTESE